MAKDVGNTLSLLVDEPDTVLVTKGRRRRENQMATPQSELLQETWLLSVIMCESYFLNTVKEHQSERCGLNSLILPVLLKAKEIKIFITFYLTTIL